MSLLIEAFGRLSRDPNLPGIVDEEEEDLYSVFRARSELMCWTSMMMPRPPRLLVWEMEEAELTAGSEGDMIGWVQVGLDVDDVDQYTGPPTHPSRSGIYRRPIETALVLPALIQCFYDSLRRFGAVELSALQVTATYLFPSPRPYSHNINSVQNWFNTTLKTRENALISVDQNFLAGRSEAELLRSGSGPNRYPSLEFGPVAAVPMERSIKNPFPGTRHSFLPAPFGVWVKLPEWAADAAAWALAILTNRTLVEAPGITEFAIRITRVP